MVEGRMKKFTGEVSLTGQPFRYGSEQVRCPLLKDNNADVTGFIRFEVGEGIEKVETDFAAEVAAMSKQSLIERSRLRAASLSPVIWKSDRLQCIAVLILRHINVARINSHLNR